MFQVNPLGRGLTLKNKALFSSKDKSKKLKCRLLHPKISLEIGSAQLSIALINLFSDILAQSLKIWWKRPCFIIKPNGSRNSFYYFFKDTPYPNYSKPLCVYVCTIIIHIMCEWRAEAVVGWGRQSTAVKRKNGVGYLHFLSTDRMVRGI